MMNIEQYTTLETLLSDGKWREADEVTYRLMLKVTSRDEEGWMRPQDISTFPCEDLLTIDRLWTISSQGKFGFGVQKAIYQSLSDEAENFQQIWQQFCIRIGWCVEGKWLTYPECIFHLAAPMGHLPRYASLHIGTAAESDKIEFWGDYLFARLETCGNDPLSSPIASNIFTSLENTLEESFLFEDSDLPSGPLTDRTLD